MVHSPFFFKGYDTIDKERRSREEDSSSKKSFSLLRVAGCGFAGKNLMVNIARFQRFSCLSILYPYLPYLPVFKGNIHEKHVLHEEKTLSGQLFHQVFLLQTNSIGHNSTIILFSSCNFVYLRG
jgi:hypothetical protein